MNETAAPSRSDIEGWFVWTVVDHIVVRLQTFVDEADARAAAGLGQNDSP